MIEKTLCASDLPDFDPSEHLQDAEEIAAYLSVTQPSRVGTASCAHPTLLRAYAGLSGFKSGFNTPLAHIAPRHSPKTNSPAPPRPG